MMMFESTECALVDLLHNTVIVVPIHFLCKRLLAFQRFSVDIMLEVMKKMISAKLSSEVPKKKLKIPPIFAANICFGSLINQRVEFYMRIYIHRKKWNW